MASPTTTRKMSSSTNHHSTTTDQQQQQQEQFLSTSDLCRILEQEIRNMGASLRCSVCLSTYQNPVQLSCRHVFCKACIIYNNNASCNNNNNSNRECPLCKHPQTKRSYQSCDSTFAPLIGAYKQLLRHAGLAPIVYRPDLDMTQMAPPTKKTTTTSSSTASTTAMQIRMDVQVSQWMQHSLPTVALKRWHQPLVQVNEQVLREQQQQQVQQQQGQQQQVQAAATTTATALLLPAVQSGVANSQLAAAAREQCAADASILEDDEEWQDYYDPNEFEDESKPAAAVASDSVAAKDASSPRQQPPTALSKDDCGGDGEHDRSSNNAAAKKLSAPEPEEEHQPVEEFAPEPAKVPTNEPTKELAEKEPSKSSSNNDHNCVQLEQSMELLLSGSQDTAAKAVDNSYESCTALAVGAIVRVQPRTWPGMNKLGGVARITGVCDNNNTYDVHYVLGGKERVDAVFVAPHHTEGGMEDDDEGGVGRKSSRRIAKLNQEQLPATLLAELAAQGFDTSGEVSAKENRSTSNARKRASSSDNDTSEPPKKRKRMVQRIGAVLSNLVKRDRQEQPPKDPPKVSPPPNWTNEEKCQRADAWYQSQFENVLNKSVVYAMASSLNESDSSALESLCKGSKKSIVQLKVTSSFRPGKTAICVMSVDPRSEGTVNLIASHRTLKAMQCALAGVPIVSPAWIHSCLTNQSIQSPVSSMLVRSLPICIHGSEDDGLSFGVAGLAAGILSNQAKLLSGLYVFVCGHYPRNKEADMMLLLRQSGASILASLSGVLTQWKSNNGDKVVLICGDNPTFSTAFKKELRSRSQSANLVTDQWLFDSITKGGPVDVEGYIPTSPKIKELRTMAD